MSIFRSVAEQEEIPKIVDKLGYLDLRVIKNGHAVLNLSDIMDELPRLATEFKREFEASVLAKRELLDQGDPVLLAEVAGLPLVYNNYIGSLPSGEKGRKVEKAKKIISMFHIEPESSIILLREGILIENWMHAYPVSGPTPSISALAYSLESDFIKIQQEEPGKLVDLPYIDTFISIKERQTFCNDDESEGETRGPNAIYSTLRIIGGKIKLSKKAIEEINKWAFIEINRHLKEKILQGDSKLT